MFLRQALLAAILVSGTAAAAAAQSDEFPFRRFGSRNRMELRRDMHLYRFNFRNSDRFRADAGRIRLRVQERAHDLAEHARIRGFDSRVLDLRLRNRAFAMRDDAGGNRREFRMRDMELLRDRIRDRMDHFRFERALIMRRHSRTI